MRRGCCGGTRTVLLGAKGLDATGKRASRPAGSRVYSTLPLTIINVVAISCGAGGKWSWRKNPPQPLHPSTPTPTRRPSVSPSPHPPLSSSQWCRLFVWRDEQTNMAVLGKGTKTHMPVVEATGKAQDTTVSIPNLLFRLPPLLPPE